MAKKGEYFSGLTCGSGQLSEGSLKLSKPMQISRVEVTRIVYLMPVSKCETTTCVFALSQWMCKNKIKNKTKSLIEVNGERKFPLKRKGE